MNAKLDKSGHAGHQLVSAIEKFNTSFNFPVFLYISSIGKVSHYLFVEHLQANSKKTEWYMAYLVAKKKQFLHVQLFVLNIKNKLEILCRVC